MESLNKAASWAAKVASKDAATTTALAAAFAVLMVRSFDQQRDIDALEAEKASLISSNKEMKMSMWSWKQALFAAAAAESESPPLVPLSRLRAIYGDAPTPKTGDGSKEDYNSSASKLVI